MCFLPNEIDGLILDAINLTKELIFFSLQMSDGDAAAARLLKIHLNIVAHILMFILCHLFNQLQNKI